MFQIHLVGAFTMGEPSRISVALRFRPLSQAERSDPSEHGDSWALDASSVRETGAGAAALDASAAGTNERTEYNKQRARAGKRFVFDHVLGPDATNEDVYDNVAAPVSERLLGAAADAMRVIAGAAITVQHEMTRSRRRLCDRMRSSTCAARRLRPPRLARLSHLRQRYQVIVQCIDGFHGTLFAYGMTSSGKTHTLMGTPHDPGMVVLAIHDVFDQLNTRVERREVGRRGAGWCARTAAATRTSATHGFGAGWRRRVYPGGRQRQCASSNCRAPPSSSPCLTRAAIASSSSSSSVLFVAAAAR